MSNVTQLATPETKSARALSMTPDAIRRRAKRAQLNEAKTTDQANAIADKVMKDAIKKKPAARKLPTAAPIKVSAAQKRTIGQFCAAIAAGFLPIASFMIAHYEAAQQPLLWVLVAAALMFSAPTLAAWAQKWAGNVYKAWGFTVLLEGVMVASHIQWLSFTGLAILVLINATNAWGLAAKKTVE